MLTQITFFDNEPKPGDTTEDRNEVGKPLTWEEACAHIGQVIWYARIMQSMTYWEAVVPEKRLDKAITFYTGGEALNVEKSDRLICYNGHSQRLLIDEHFCTGKYKYPEGSAFFGQKQ